VKWIGLIIVLIAAAVLAEWIRRDPKIVPKVLIAMGFLPFMLDPFHLYMAAISWPDWPGYVKGTEISVLDGLALALYFGLPRPRHSIPFRIAMLLYFAAVLLSVIHADFTVAAMFYPWQLARMFLVYAAVGRACVLFDAPIAILAGMAGGLFMEAVVALWERFALHMAQAGGTVHQNLLGVMSHLALFPCFALLLAGRRGWAPVVGTLIGILVEVLTTSRATIGLGFLAFATVFALSATRQWSPRKGMILLGSVAALVVLVPVIMMSFQQRFEKVDLSDDYDERAAFQKAASLMIADHPFGVGPNHYVLAANLDGYNRMGGVAAVTGSESTNVHNVYMLVTAETGFLGLMTFIVLLLRSMGVAFLCGWRHPGDQRGDLLLGLGVALLTVYLHSFFEWIFVTFQVQYMFAMDLGLIAGVSQQLGYRTRAHYARQIHFRGAPLRARPGGMPGAKRVADSRN